MDSIDILLFQSDSLYLQLAEWCKPKLTGKLGCAICGLLSFIQVVNPDHLLLTELKEASKMPDIAVTENLFLFLFFGGEKVILLLFKMRWQVFQVRKVTGANTSKIFAMKVLKKVRWL